LVASGNELDINSTGFLGGGHVGFNYQFGSWVVGVEGEGSWTDLSISRISSSLVSGTSVGFSADSNWLAMATARVGYTAYQFLFYLKGGVAWMDVDYTASALTGGVVTNSITVNDTRLGWVVGGGAQLALSNNWSIRAEYNYIDFGTEQFLFPLAAGTTTVDVYSQIHAFKVGASYLFN
jgi:outer membrane immunogenic protein